MVDAQVPETAEDEPGPIDVMLYQFGNSDPVGAARTAEALLQQFPDLDTVEAESRDAFGLIRTAATCVLNFGAGLELVLSRRFGDGALRMEQAAEAAAEPHPAIDGMEVFDILIDTIAIAARMQVPLLRANEHMVRGSLGPANMELASAESQVGKLIDIMDMAGEEQNEAQAARVATATSVFYLFFFIGSLINMQNAAMGQRLLQARMFFETNERRLADLGGPGVFPAPFARAFEVFLVTAEGAKARVMGEIAVTEGRFDDALKQFDVAETEFYRASVEIPSDFPQAGQFREVVQNQSIGLAQRRNSVNELKALHDKLLSATEASQAAKAQADELERYYRDRLAALMEREFPIKVDVTQNVEAQFAQQVQVAQANAQMVQDRAIDQVLLLLEHLKGDEAEALKDEARAARSEKDLAKKIERVTKVLDGVGKLAEAASNLVPYGRTVYGVLKGLLG